MDELDIGDHAFAQNREWGQTDLVNPLKSVTFPDELRVLQIGREGFHQYLQNDDYATGNFVNSLESVSFPMVVEEISVGNAAFMQRISGNYLDGENRLGSVWFPDGLKKLTLNRKAIGQAGGRIGQDTRVANSLTRVSFPAGMWELYVDEEGIVQSILGQKDESPNTHNKLAVIEFRFSDQAGFPESMTIGDLATSSPILAEWLWYGYSGTMLDLWGTVPNTAVGRFETGVCVAVLPDDSTEEIPNVGSKNDCNATAAEKEASGDWIDHYWRTIKAINANITLSSYQPVVFELDAGGSVAETKTVTGIGNQGVAPALGGSVCGASDPGADADVSRCQYVYPQRDTGAVSAAWDLKYPNVDLSATGPVWPAFDATATVANGKPIYNQFKVSLPDVDYIWNPDDPSQWIYQFNGWCMNGLQANGRCQTGSINGITAGTNLGFGANASAADRTYYAQWTIQQPTIGASTTTASGIGVPGSTVTVYEEMAGTTRLCDAVVQNDKTWSCDFPAEKAAGETVYAQQTRDRVRPCCMVEATTTSGTQEVTVIKAALGDHSSSGGTFDADRNATTLNGGEFALYSVGASDSCVANPTKIVSGTGKASGIAYELEVDSFYCLYETKSPGGFELLAEPIKFKFLGNDKSPFAQVISGGANSIKLTTSSAGPWQADDPEIYVLDTSAVPMPVVGGNGPGGWLLAGLGAFVMGVALLLRQRRIC